ncbi:MAG: Stp1/IreP family PP2C-type Ser/Thr phosphatase, partial [Chloroflexota bacterium]
ELCVMFEAENPEQWAKEKRLFESRIAHPAIAPLIDVFEQAQYDNQPRAYLVTEYPMVPLAQLGAPSEFNVLAWGAQLAGGLAYLHDNDFAHGNVQPASLVMTENKQVKLWNLADTRALTPELRDWDILQLAKALYQFAMPSGQAVPMLSPDATQVFERAFAQDPRQRYHDARTFADDLENALNALRHPKGITCSVGRITDVGQKRELNEDAFVTLDLLQAVQQGSQSIGLFVVADGMGGAVAGEVASKMVTQVMARHVLTHVFNPQFSAQPARLDYGAILQAAVEQANAEIYQMRSAARTDMGSTVVAALVIGNRAHIVNVGDSRAYLIAPDHIEKITKDHSLVQAFVDRNEIGEDDVYTHPQRNFILRNVGDKAQVQVDSFAHTFEPGQYLLLCSDGLWEMVYPKSRLHEIVTRAPSAQEACKELVNAANKNGGDDNITIVLVKFEAT